MMLGKKQFREIFLFEFKMGRKAVETTLNVNSAFAPGTVNEYTVQWWSRSFVKETRILKMEEHSGLPSEVDNDQLRGSLKVILLQLHEKLPKNSVSNILWSFGTWSKLERWGSCISECLMRWLQFRRIILKCGLLLFYATTANHFLIRLWYSTKSGFYINQLSGWTKKMLQRTSHGHTCTKKGHGHCLVVCCLSYPLQLSESWGNHYI